MKTNSLLFHAFILLLGVFIASVSQVLLKVSAQKQHNSSLREYFNPLVIIAYAIFILTTFMAIYAYKRVPISLGPVLESTSYFYVTFFGVRLFNEKINMKKVIALFLIILGIFVFSYV